MAIQNDITISLADSSANSSQKPIPAESWSWCGYIGLRNNNCTNPFKMKNQPNKYHIDLSECVCAYAFGAIAVAIATFSTLHFNYKIVLFMIISICWNYISGTSKSIRICVFMFCVCCCCSCFILFRFDASQWILPTCCCFSCRCNKLPVNQWKCTMFTFLFGLFGLPIGLAYNCHLIYFLVE